MKNYQHDAGHMNKMAAMPIYGEKHLKNLLLWNQWTDFHETWYVASGTHSILFCSNDYPGFTLTYFTPRSKFCNFGFSLWKM